MKRPFQVASLLLLVTLLLPAWQLHRKRDPLTSGEIDNLREYAQEPEKRLKFYVEYADRRMAWVTAPPGEDPLYHDRRPTTAVEAIEDFTAIVDEIDDNVDMYNRQRYRISKPLKLIQEGETRWSQQVKAWLKDPASLSKEADERARLVVALKEADQTLTDSAEDLKDIIAEQKQMDEDTKKDPKKK